MTGAIGSGKSTLADYLGQVVQNHALYETNGPVIEVANRFNQLLEAELNFATTDNDTELVNQLLIWMPDIITEHLHHDTTWTHLALNPKDIRTHPELYEKLFAYVARVRKDPKLAEQTITTDNKATYRDLLQWLGGYFVAKLSPTIWYDELFRRIDLHDAHRDLILVSGVRYLSDAVVIREHRGRLLKVTRPDTTPTHSDITEAERDKIEPDITIVNNGSLADLQLLAENLWNDIAAGAPQKEYRAV